MTTKGVLVTLSLCFLLVGPLSGQIATIVRTREGWIGGVTRSSENGRQFLAFLGVPYAEPPLGDRRFENSIPKKRWRSLWKADKDPPVCPQSKGGFIRGDEDCLYLNVYTPRINVSRRESLAVIVYIPGGGFISGDGRSDHWGPEYILDRDVILVTVQYRLGVLGFLSTGDAVAPGNYGLKDQVLALRWVQRNIQRLGGDPNRITLAGHSAGGTSVATHSLSSLSRGLFHRYIEMSGNPYLGWSTHKGRMNNYVSIERRFASSCGCPTNDSLSMVNCLRRINVTDLIALNELFHTELKGTGASWSVTVESNSKTAFLREDPARTVRERGKLDVPFMMGIVKDDGLTETLDIFVDDNRYKKFMDNMDDYIKPKLEYFLDSEQAISLIDKVKNYYYGNHSIADRRKLLHATTNFVTDLFFAYSLYRVANSQLRHGTQPFYAYSFDYRGSFSRTSKITRDNEDVGVYHADELTYLFKQDPSTLGTPNGTYSANDKKMMRLMVDLWTSFATDGESTSGELKNPFEWRPYTAERNYLRIGQGGDTATELRQNLRRREMEFWAPIIGP